jgi:hypothetical protein
MVLVEESGGKWGIERFYRWRRNVQTFKPIPNLQTLHLAWIIYPNLPFVKYQTLQTLYKNLYKIAHNVQ